MGLLIGALLLTSYAHGGSAWVLGFVALVPWLWVLDRKPTLAGSSTDGMLATFDVNGPDVNHLVCAFGRLVG